MISSVPEKIYTEKNSEYLSNNPSWHIEDSPWKAQKIVAILKKNNIAPNKVVEIGCGAGEILKQLSNQYPNTHFHGYDISIDAYKLALTRSSEKLKFYNENLLEKDLSYDLLLMMDVFEHVEDYFGFIKLSSERAVYKLFHIPLEMSASFVLRNQMMVSRKKYGHIHYFSKDTALATLKNCNLEIVDYMYTAASVEVNNTSPKTKLVNIPRQILYKINPDLSARIFGGYSLLVLAK